MHFQHYLARIGHRGNVRPDFATLCALLKAHACTVPFENIDVQMGRPLTTNVEEAYEKIVGAGRGGWCYQQNGLFGWALSQVGFDVTRIAAAVMRQDQGDAANAGHLCLLVRCPGKPISYLVDVGFGGSMIRPIELTESAYSQPPFRIGLRKLTSKQWRFWEDLGGDPFSYDFVAEPASEQALSAKCSELQTDPASGFVLNLVAQLRSATRHITLRGRVVRTATAAGVETMTLNSADALVSALASLFALDVPEVAELWPGIVARHEEIFG